MTLDVTPEEHAVLAHYFLELQNAEKVMKAASHAFQAAFRASLAARGLKDGVFASLTPTQLTIDTPDAFTTG